MPSSIKPPPSDPLRSPSAVPPAPAEVTEKKTATAVDSVGRAPEASDTSVATPSPAPSLPPSSSAANLATVFADNMEPLLAELTTTAQGGYVDVDSATPNHTTQSALHQSYEHRHDQEMLNDFILMRLATMARTESSDDDDSRRDAIKREQKAARIKRQAHVSEQRHDSNELMDLSKVSHGWPAKSDLLSFVEPTVVAWASAVHTGAPAADISIELDAASALPPAASDRAGPLEAPLAAAATSLTDVAHQQGISAMLTAMPAVIEQALVQAGFAPELPETQKISRALQTQVLASLFPEAPPAGDLGLLAAVVGRTLDAEQHEPLPPEPAAVVEASLESALDAIRKWAEKGADRQSRPIDILP